MRGRACVYQQTNQNIAPVIIKFSKQQTESDRISHRFEALRHILRLFMEHTQFFLSQTAYRKPYWKCLVKYSAHFVASFFKKTTRCIGEILVGFQRR